MENTKAIENSALEAIYSWNRNEGFYYAYFSRLTALHHNTEMYDFFVTKIFREFLTTYSVRRNVPAGDLSIKAFASELMTSGFIQQVAEGNICIVDEFSSKLKEKRDLSNNKETRSLLSKIAFLVNPDRFSLMDSYAKDSLWRLIKDSENIRKSDLDSYASFSRQINNFMTKYPEWFRGIEKTLARFEGTDAFSFFSTNPEAYKRRVFDKFLWLKKASRSGRNIDSSAYRKLLNFENHKRGAS